jgi:hypothetical protein
MRIISLWARHHLLAARVLIGAIHVLLIFIALYISQNFHFTFSYVQIVLVLCVLLGASIIYRYSKKASYTFQRILMFITACCFFLLTCILFKSNFIFSNYQQTLGAVSFSVANKTVKPTAQEILESLKYRDKNTLSKNEKRILKKEFKKQLGIYAKAAIEKDEAAKSNAWLIIVTIVAAVGLFLLLAALACSISCNGAEVLGIILLMLGTAGLVWGSIAIIKGIKRKKMRKMQQQNT